MEQAGLWMLLAVPVLLIVTGLPAFVVLLLVSTVSAAAGVAFGAISASFLTALPSRVIGLLENDLLQAIPLFVFMGVLLDRLPLADILYRCAQSIGARTTAAPRLAALALGTLLAPMNGSVGASVTTLSRVVAPKLRARGIGTEESCALVCVASTLGVVVPPSLVLILFGDAMLRAHTEAANATGRTARIINTQDIFHGALIPAGIFLVLCFAIAWWQGRRDVRQSPIPASRGERALAAVTLLFVGGLLVGTAAGYIYAVEAAALGTFGLFAGGVLARQIGLGLLGEMLRATMATTGALFALFVAATTFTLVFRAFGTPALVEELFAKVADGQTSAVFAGLAIIGAFGLVLDAFEIIFVIVPILLPPVLVRVPDASWVAILTLLALQCSFLVPPLGYATMLARGLAPAGLHTGRFAKALLWFLAAQILVLGLTFAVPRVVHWTPVPAANDAPRPESPADDDTLVRQLEQQENPDGETPDEPPDEAPEAPADDPPAPS